MANSPWTTDHDRFSLFKEHSRRARRRLPRQPSGRRYDVILLINGIPAAQIELKTLGINPRRAIEQIVEYKNDPGNGYTRTILCFVQLFIVTNRDSTYYFANNNTRHFAFNADERFLPIYEHALLDNSKVKGLDAFAEAFLAKCTLAETISRYIVLVLTSTACRPRRCKPSSTRSSPA